VKGLVDFQVYCDGIASAIGVVPPLGRLFFTRPWLWAKVLFGPLTTHQYRLVGPGADPARAEEVNIQ
jgi:dimethylaniline monooxygenase (N-oxide forming)